MNRRVRFRLVFHMSRPPKDERLAPALPPAPGSIFRAFARVVPLLLAACASIVRTCLAHVDEIRSECATAADEVGQPAR
jgi:hypothetical protein